MSNRVCRVYLIVAGDFHDMDFPRLELLKLLAENPKIRTEVATDYHDIDAIMESDVLITYTVNRVPTEQQQKAVRRFVETGKRWFALHGTNSIIAFRDDGLVDCPETAPVFMETLGTQFIAHPPIQPFKVTVSKPDHELVAGIGEFTATDELYLSRIHGDIEILLETRYTGPAQGFVEDQWPDDEPRPVYYVKKVGDGEVLYLNLGHARGHYDMQPMMDYYPEIERGSWENPEFYELLRRGIAYCADPITG